MINITIDSGEINAALDRIAQNTSNLYQPLDEIGQTIEDNIGLLFRDTKDPKGEPWKPLAQSTIDGRRGHSSIPLNDTGILKNSITHNVVGNSVEVGANDQSKDYAATMNFGDSSRNIPARPFLPEEQLPTEWAREILDILATHINPE